MESLEQKTKEGKTKKIGLSKEYKIFSEQYFESPEENYKGNQYVTGFSFCTIFGVDAPDDL